jgi:beta-ureidopropionase / N-carbamoyl-L-amino-acid hydrolase
MLTNSPRLRDGNSNAEGAKLGRRILSLADRLAKHSETTDGLTCTFMTPAHRATAAELRMLMSDAGMMVDEDVVGNVIGRYRATGDNAATLIIGSHYDTVRNAGKYDGRLGILAGIVVVEELRRQKATLSFNVDVVGFSEEEGIRFSIPFIGSAAMAGRFDQAILSQRDAEGYSLGEVLRHTGGDAASIAAIRRPSPLLGYVEVHIEQGPVLLHEGLPLGVVSAIAGLERHRIKIRGVAGHAGTVPMSLRHDAAAAAAEIIALVEQRCLSAPGLMGTVGQLHVPGGAINVIPALCELSLDIRAGQKQALTSAVADVLAGIEAIATRRGVTVETEKLVETTPTPCSPRLQKALAAALAQQGVAVRHLVSGAGHDAIMFDGLTDIGMLFVRCGNGGVSHSPVETITAEDADLAVRVLLDLLINLESG